MVSGQHFVASDKQVMSELGVRWNKRATGNFKDRIVNLKAFKLEACLSDVIVRGNKLCFLKGKEYIKQNLFDSIVQWLRVHL